MKAKNLRLSYVLLAAAPILLGCALYAGIRASRGPREDGPGLYAAELKNEYQVGATAWQLSAEAHALMEQSFRTASGNVRRCMEKCLDPDEPD